MSGPWFDALKGTDGRVTGSFGEGTWARKFDIHPIIGEEAARLSSLSNTLRVLHVNGCIYDNCPECDAIAELAQILVYRHGRAEMNERAANSQAGPA